MTGLLSLTDIVVKAHQGAGELALVLHENPDGAANAAVDELEGQDGAGHGGEVVDVGGGTLLVV